MGVKLQSSSGGSVEIAAPVTASNYTLTAPTTSSTIDTLARTGNVLQVVQGTYSTTVSSSSSTFADTGLTASITPTNANSKILVFVSQQGVGKSASSSGNAVQLRILRDSTVIYTTSDLIAYNALAQQNRGAGVPLNYLDTPNTINTVVYKTQFASFANAAAAVSCQDWGSANNATSTIILMEIAG